MANQLYYTAGQSQKAVSANFTSKQIRSINSFSVGTEFRHQNHRHQILTSKVSPRTDGIKIFIMVVDPKHRYLNDSETANWDTYGDFKLKKTTFSLQGLYRNISALRTIYNPVWYHLKHCCLSVVFLLFTCTCVASFWKKTLSILWKYDTWDLIVCKSK